MAGPPRELATDSARLAVDVDIERALLGSFLLGAGPGRPEPPTLAPSRLGSPRHRLIWGAILDLHRRGLPYDLPSVASRLREQGRLEEVGGIPFLSALEAVRLTNDTVAYYVSRIRSKAAQRAFAGLGRAISGLALVDAESGDEPIASRYHTLIRRADVACDVASRNGNRPSLHLSTMYQIATQALEPMPWVYEPWLSAGDVVILAGEPGLGKSWLALDAVFSLSLNRPCLGKENAAHKRQTVLYVDEENNPRLVRFRVQRMVVGLDLGLSDLDPAGMPAWYAIEQGVNLDDAGSLALLRAKVEQLRPDWIIFDSLVRIHRRDENSNADMAALIGGIIKPLARKVGAGAIIVHHLSKPSKDRGDSMHHRVRGASDIIGVADQAWGLERHEDALLLRHLKCRSAQASGPLTVRIEDVQFDQGVRITYEDADLSAVDEIVDALRRAGNSMLRQEIISCTALDPRIASRALGSLVDSGRMTKIKEGKSVRYTLNEGQ